MLPTPNFREFKDRHSIAVETAAFLVHQGNQSYNAQRAKCLYRGPSGLKCAVGYWIPDEDYSVDMENVSVKAISKMEVLNNLALVRFFNRHMTTFEVLQNIHDSFDSSYLDKGIIGALVEAHVFISDIHSTRTEIEARIVEMSAISPKAAQGTFFL